MKLPKISLYNIKNILKYYETKINNSSNAHSCDYFLAKENLTRDEIELIILKRKGLYYELKYSPTKIVTHDSEGKEDTEIAIEEYIKYVDERLESQKTNAIFFRDLIVFYKGTSTDICYSGELTETGDIKLWTDAQQAEIIDEKIQTLYDVVF